MYIPLSDRVLIKPERGATQTDGGFEIPEEKQHVGEVISVGPNVTSVIAGQTVLFGKYGGTEVEIDETTHIIMREQDLIAIKQ